MNNPVWTVKKVIPRSDYTLVLFFENGQIKLFNAKPLLQKPIYKALKNLNFFMKASASCGTVVWDENIDIAPEYLYEHGIPIKKYELV